MDEGSGGPTRRPGAGRRLLSNPRLGRGRCARVFNLFLRRLSRTSCTGFRRSTRRPNAEPDEDRGEDAVRVAMANWRAICRLHHLAAAGRRRYGRGLSGAASQAAAARRDQGPRRGGHRGSRIPRQVQPGGRSGRDAVAPARRRSPRPRRIQRSALDFHGLRRGHRCQRGW